MKTEPAAAKRAKVHTRYYNQDGKLVPGVTTILGVLNKPALVPWANALGLQGINVGTYVDTLAQIGTIAHEMVSCHLQNKPFEKANIPADMIDAAENSFLKYLEWERRHKVEPILVEAPLVCAGYGGTIDFYGKIDGVLTLMDFKTAKAIWPEHLYQVAAYRTLLIIKGHEVRNVGILQIGRSEDEGFSEKFIADCYREAEIFTHCLALYNLGVTKRAA